MHPEKKQLHLYLDGTLGLVELQALEAHLTDCPACSQSLAEVAAEDAVLSDSLGLDAAEMAWVDSVDLVEPVMAQIAPRFRLTAPLVLTSLLVILAGYLGGSLWSVGASLLPDLASAGAIVRLLRSLGPALIRLLIWMVRGGLLTTIWPLLTLGAALGFWRLTRTKEMNPHA